MAPEVDPGRLPPAGPVNGTGDRTSSLEHRLGQLARARLPGPVRDFGLFVLKQGWACLFGGLLLAAILLTRAVWSEDWPVARYDALLVFAIVVQAAFLRFRLETWDEARVILLFHLTGTAMEWFKVGAGSWSYPEPGVLKLFDVPLFSGFMYASVGSYIARVIRIFRMDFAPYPRFGLTVALAAAIYVNFFSHHFLPDIRWLLVVATLAIFGRTWIGFDLGRRHHMPLPLAAFLSSLFLWVAENVGTMTGTWIYAGRVAGEMTDPSKMVSWYLLLYVAFVTVTLVIRAPASAGSDSARPAAEVR